MNSTFGPYDTFGTYVLLAQRKKTSMDPLLALLAQEQQYIYGPPFWHFWHDYKATL